MKSARALGGVGGFSATRRRGRAAGGIESPSPLRPSTSPSRHDSFRLRGRDKGAEGHRQANLSTLSCCCTSRDTAAPGDEGTDAEETSRLDKLIDVFMKREETTWIRLMAQSRRWGDMREAFFERVEDRARGADASVTETFLARVKEIGSIYEKRKLVFDKVVGASDFDREGVVALFGQDLDQDFFDFARDVILGFKDDREEQERLASAMSAVIALRDAQQELLEENDPEALQRAAENFSQILEAPTLEAAEQEIDSLLDVGGMDPALMMMMAKAWAGAKESSMMKEEAKDVMFHLYNKARQGLGDQQPCEFKILKFVVSQPTPRERRDALEAAFTPGLNYEDADTEYLSTTPERLLETVESVLGVYEMQRMKYMAPMSGGGGGPGRVLRTDRGGDLTGSQVFTGMMQEAATIPGANVIADLREIRVLIKREFIVGGEAKRGQEGDLWMS